MSLFTRIVMSIMGAIVFVCGFIIAQERGQAFRDGRKDSPNGLMEWLLCIIGVALVVMAYTIAK